jgi:hypothetical protein
MRVDNGAKPKVAVNEFNALMAVAHVASQSPPQSNAARYRMRQKRTQ